MSITENVALFTENQVKSEDFAYFFFFTCQFGFNLFTKRHVAA